PYFSIHSNGTTTLPLDLDIFLRSGSRTQPEIAACFHGSESNSRCERTVVENNHVRMISCACGRKSIGKVRAKRSGSVAHPHASSGVNDDVAQVSMTSGSPVNPPGWSRCDSSNPGGASVEGSTGSVSSGATIGSSPCTLPSASMGYHTGNGTPKTRCRLTSQSPFRP